MLFLITSVYFTQIEPIRDPITKKTVKRDLSDSDFEDADRNLVIVYAGSHGVQPDGKS
jgi:hypothetical protein